MNLLTENDQQGQYPPSFYADTVSHLPLQPPLKGEHKADVVIVGAGFTGLSAALHLAERGYDVAVLDAHRMGFGASGRNGGQVGSGQRVEQDRLEKTYGLDKARQLWGLAEDAKALVRHLITTHDIDCHYRDGIAHSCWRQSEVDEDHRYVEKLQREYNYEQIEPLDQNAMYDMIGSPVYRGGSIDHGAGHLHPLAYVLGLGRAALAAGVRVYENSMATRIIEGKKPSVMTDQGAIHADHLILACNGYLGALNKPVARRVMPINNFIVTTAPLDTESPSVLASDIAVADSKFVLNYFRRSHDNRLIFGGGENVSYRFPTDIRAMVSKPLHTVFPQLVVVTGFEFAFLKLCLEHEATLGDIAFTRVEARQNFHRVAIPRT